MILESLLWKVNVYSCDPELYNKFHSTTVGRLCFQDGVLDFKTQQFYTWDKVDFDYYSTVMIRRDFKTIFENRDTPFWIDQKNDVYSKVIQPFFFRKYGAWNTSIRPRHSRLLL